MENTIETVPSISKAELSARIVKDSNQLFDDYVLWHKSGWSDAEFAELVELSAATIRRHYKAPARKQGLIPPATSGRRTDLERGGQDCSPPGENSGSDGEVIDVDLSTKDPETPNEIMPTQEKPKTKKPKRPKELVKMLDTQSKYIESRLLPIAAKVTELLKEIEVEANRLGGAWEKDNLVFSTSFQECVDYWNECERFDQFGETMNDSNIKTYAEVLEKIQLRLTRASQRMETIQFSTGCIEEPNKRNLRLVS